MFLAKMFLNPSIIRRGDWGADPPSRPLKEMASEVTAVVISYTETDECKTKDQCVAIVKQIQRDNMSHDSHRDIQYNFLIGGDGNVYEGRGWKYAPDFPSKPKELKKLQGDAVAICFIGNKEMKPSYSMIKTFAGIVLKGMMENAIVKDVRKLKPCMIVNGKVVYMSPELNKKAIEKMEKAENAGFLEKYKGLMSKAVQA